MGKCNQLTPLPFKGLIRMLQNHMFIMLTLPFVWAFSGQL